MRLSRKILLTTGSSGPIRNMISAENDKKRSGIWDIQSLKVSSSNEIDSTNNKE